MTHHKFSALALLVLLCSSIAVAQQNNATADSANAAVREKAFNLLESLAGQIGTLQSAENRARLGSNIAESLWKHNEQRARALFVSVENDIKLGLGYRAHEEPIDEHTTMVFLRLREDTVERIAKHDAELALAFLKSTEPGPELPKRYGVEDRERALELRLAKQIAADNPDLALKLGRQTLARGISDDLLSLLTKINKKHKEQALVFYKEIVSKLKNTNLVQDWPAMHFARNLAYSFTPPATDDSAFRDLIGLFITTALANGCANKEDEQRSGFCHYIGALLPQMEQVDPSRAAQLKHWERDVNVWERSPQARDELEDLHRNGTVDEILALVPKYPQIEGQIYWLAMTKAQESGDTERARKIATDFSGNPETREYWLAQLDRAQEWSSINDEQMTELQKRLGETSRIKERIGILVEVANRIGAKDRKTALKLLDQASGIVDTMKPGKEHTEIQMGLAMVYCIEKSERGFAIMESVVPKLNDLVGSAAKLDGYDTRYLRDGEWNMSAEGSLGNLLTTLARMAGYFSWFDFDRAVALAAQFDRAEIRIMAQVKLAQGILAGPPNRDMRTAWK